MEKRPQRGIGTHCRFGEKKLGMAGRGLEPGTLYITAKCCVHVATGTLTLGVEWKPMPVS